jgi:hypothetical protein
VVFAQPSRNLTSKELWSKVGRPTAPAVAVVRIGVIMYSISAVGLAFLVGLFVFVLKMFAFGQFFE